jgi:hypothetical protein
MANTTAGEAVYQTGSSAVPGSAYPHRTAENTLADRAVEVLSSRCSTTVVTTERSPGRHTH